MKELPIIAPRGKRLPSVARLEALFARAGLRVTLRGTLAKYPGCVHWHLKRDRLAGTLEITRWPSESRLWISIQDGRKAVWVSKAAAELKARLER